MLGLNNHARFAVVELDTDGAADRVNALATEMAQTNPAASSTAHATPALRSAGLSVIWNGWAEQPSKGSGRDLTDLVTSQKANNAVISSYIAAHGIGPLPTFHAEDLIRGHRFDVLTTSEPSPAWRSLCFRAGTYRLGKPEHVIEIEDEGSVSAALSQPTGLVKYNHHTGAFGASVPTPPDLYAHERIARWKGWSLVAERPGNRASVQEPNCRTAGATRSRRPSQAQSVCLRCSRSPWLRRAPKAGCYRSSVSETSTGSAPGLPTLPATASR